MAYYVKLYHGPIEAFFDLNHRPEKLAGLKDELLKLGYRVHLVPVTYRNYFIIEISGQEVFRADLRNFKTNIPNSLDPVSQRAVAAIKNATGRLLFADTYFWIQSLLLRNIYTKKEFVQSEKKKITKSFPIMKHCFDCARCIKPREEPKPAEEPMPSEEPIRSEEETTVDEPLSFEDPMASEDQNQMASEDPLEDVSPPETPIQSDDQKQLEEKE